MAFPSLNRLVVRSLSKCGINSKRSCFLHHQLTVKPGLIQRPSSWNLDRFHQLRLCSSSNISRDLVELPKSTSVAIKNDSQKPLSKCFTCGEVGHKASSCPQTVCYNCGLPGHRSRDCPNERRLEVAERKKRLCHNCGEEGHVAKHCSLPRLRDTGPDSVVVVDAVEGATLVCFNCKKAGHKAKDCPKPKRCRNCGALDHAARHCPEEWRCKKCGQPGHHWTRCPVGKLCFMCGRPGHLGRDCDSMKIRAI